MGASHWEVGREVGKEGGRFVALCERMEKGLKDMYAAFMKEMCISSCGLQQ